MNAAAFLAVACFGCGVSSNRTATRTLPYHAELADLVDSDAAGTSPVAPLTAGGPVTIAPFVPYYAVPTGFLVVETNRSGWAALDAGKPEVMLGETWRHALVDGAGAGLTVHGVVTDFEWYQANAISAGRIVSLVTVVGADGRVLYEHEHATQARARIPGELVAEHVREWTRDAGFRRAIGAAP